MIYQQLRNRDWICFWEVMPLSEIDYMDHTTLFNTVKNQSFNQELSWTIWKIKSLGKNFTMLLSLTLLWTYSELDPNIFPPYAPNPPRMSPEPATLNALPKGFGGKLVWDCCTPGWDPTLPYILTATTTHTRKKKKHSQSEKFFNVHIKSTSST